MTTLAELEPVLSYLHQFAGYEDEELYSHTPDWLLERTQEISARRIEELNSSAIVQVNAITLGVATVLGSSDAKDALNDWMEQLGVTSDDEAHLLNPDAKTDYEALKRSGMYQGES